MKDVVLKLRQFFSGTKEIAKMLNFSGVTFKFTKLKQEKFYLRVFVYQLFYITKAIYLSLFVYSFS